MACCSGSSLTSVVALLGLSAMGVGGYTYFSGDCGACGAPETALVSQDAPSACCAGHETTTVAQEGSCCETEKAEAIAVAHTEGASECCAAQTAAQSECCEGQACAGCCEGEAKAQTTEQIAQKNSGR